MKLLKSSLFAGLVFSTLFGIFQTKIVNSQPTITDDQLRKQDCWKWNPNNQKLYYGCNGINHGSSYNYVLSYVPEGYKYVGDGQDCWKWNPNNQELYYGCNPNSPDYGSSYNYVLYHGSTANRHVSQGQDCWKWNPNNQKLYYGCNPNSPDYGSSYNYVLEYQ